MIFELLKFEPFFKELKGFKRNHSYAFKNKVQVNL
jgi:hypothetical protein